MSISIGELQLAVTIDMSNVQSGLSDVSRRAEGGLVNSFRSASAIAAGVLIANLIEGGLNLVGDAIDRVRQGLEASVAVFQENQKSFTSLSFTAKRYGQDSEAAARVTKELAAELNLGLGTAAEGLQNLISDGLGLDESANLMRRFTNEAILGKSASISLDDAVRNLSFAYKTQNSALGNLSGMSENWSDIIDRGYRLLENTEPYQKQIKAITENAKKRGESNAEIKKEIDLYKKSQEGVAKHLGTLDLTNTTLGATAQFTDTLSTAQTRLNRTTNDIQNTIGGGLEPIIKDMTNNINDLVTRGWNFLQSIFEKIRPDIDSLKESFSSLTGLIFDQTSPTGQALQSVGDKLRTTFSSSVVDLIKNLAARFAEFVQFLQTPEGQATLKDWADGFKRLGDIVDWVVGAIRDVIKFFLEAMRVGLEFQRFLSRLQADINKNGAIGAAWNIITGKSPAFNGSTDNSKTINQTNIINNNNSAAAALAKQNQQIRSVLFK